MFKTRQKFGDSFLTIVHLLVSENNVRKIVKFDRVEHFGLSKKAAVVSNFCLIGKIHHNFLVPKMIELGRKTFMPIQTLDLHRVERNHSKYVGTMLHDKMIGRCFYLVSKAALFIIFRELSTKRLIFCFLLASTELIYNNVVM